MNWLCFSSMLPAIENHSYFYQTPLPPGQAPPVICHPGQTPPAEIYAVKSPLGQMPPPVKRPPIRKW